MKPNKFVYLKCTEDSFYRMWFEFLTPFHKLTSRERDVAARIVAQWFRLGESISDPIVRNDVMWSQTSRCDMRESLGMSPAHFQMILGKLRQAGVLVDGAINKRYIPPKTGDPRFVLSIIFDWSSKANPINAKEQAGGE